MFTVMVALVWSGNSSTCNPLASAYSVIPSTEVTFTGAGALAGRAAGAVADPAGLAGRGAAACGVCAMAGAAASARATTNGRDRSVMHMIPHKVRRAECACGRACEGRPTDPASSGTTRRYGCDGPGRYNPVAPRAEVGAIGADRRARARVVHAGTQLPGAGRHLHALGAGGEPREVAPRFVELERSAAVAGLVEERDVRRRGRRRRYGRRACAGAPGRGQHALDGAMDQAHR